MNEYLASLDTLPPWLIISCVITIAALVLLIVRYLMITNLVRIAKNSRVPLEEPFVKSLRMPMNLLIAVVLIQLLDNLFGYYEIGNDQLSQKFSTASQVLLIVSIIIFVDRISSDSLKRASVKSALLRNSSGLVFGFTRLFIMVMGGLVLLGTLGISVTPLIASLGITSLAVALALQPTLENFFSGVQLIADKPIRVGDFIELESGEQGFVQKIGWRSTWIKMLPNNIIIMPNSVLSQSKLINYYYPEKELSVPVDVGVHYDSDLEFVEQVTLEVAREVLKTHKWGVPEYETFVVFHTFDSSSINFTVMLRAREYFNRFWVKSAFIKALHKRYAEEGIVIPYPIRAINTKQESARFDNTD